MGSFLNLVYDEWDYSNPKNIINGQKYFGNDFRHMDTIILKRIGFNHFKCHDIKDINDFLPNENYYYIISQISGLEAKLSSDFELPLSQEVISCASNNNNFNIIFFNYVEVESRECLLLVDKKIKSLNINPNQVWVTSNSSNIYKYKNEEKLDINVFKHKIIDIDTANDLINNAGNVEFNVNKDGCFFMCQNRMPRSHRYGILVSLMKNKLLYDTDWSILEGGFENTDQEYYNPVFTQDDIKESIKEIEYFSKIDRKKTKFEELFNDELNKDHKPWNKAFEKKTFYNTYINIVNETLFTTEDIHITEKSFNPLYFFQYPLIVASPYHIKTLKEEHDIDLFEDMINLEYDNEKDHIKRFSMIIDEIKRIHKNKEHFINSYEKNYDRFLHNHNKVIEMSQNKNEDYKFFDNLIK